MRVTEVEIKLARRHDRPGSERLLAGAHITLDGVLVVHDAKVIESEHRGRFVAMPDRKVTDCCGLCGTKNHLRARFCNECGRRLADGRGEANPETGRVRYHIDVVHPLDTRTRRMIEAAVLDAYERAIAAEAEAPEIAGRLAPPLAGRLARA